MGMSETTSTKRPVCAVCHRPQRACFCQWVTPIAHETEVLILQHPLEVDHAKNTARLLHLSLPHSRLLVGETFDVSTLEAALQGPKYTVLLYPHTTPLTGQRVAGGLDNARLQAPQQLRLVVLDATWRKSRKMLHVNPLLQALPRWSLDNVPDSLYAIRKAHKPGQLSTLEATCVALMQLEAQPDTVQPLLDAFKGFVAQQQAFDPQGGGGPPRHAPA